MRFLLRGRHYSNFNDDPYRMVAGNIIRWQVDDVPEHGHNGFGQTPGFPLILLLFGQSCEETKTPKWTNFIHNLVWFRDVFDYDLFVGSNLATIEFYLPKMDDFCSLLDVSILAESHCLRVEHFDPRLCHHHCSIYL